MSGTRDIDALLRARLVEGSGLLIPPPCLLEMEGEVLAYDDGHSLELRFPVLARYRNPMGHMQGGFVVAALDNTLGPFSYLIAPPSVTTALNTQFLRPVTAATPFIVCRAELVERTRSQLYLRGVVRAPDGKVLALCQASCQILAQDPGPQPP